LTFLQINTRVRAQIERNTASGTVTVETIFALARRNCRQWDWNREKAEDTADGIDEVGADVDANLGVVALLLALQAEVKQAAADNGFIRLARSRTRARTNRQWQWQLSASRQDDNANEEGDLGDFWEHGGLCSLFICRWV